MTAVHSYRCASCSTIFESDGPAGRCPGCGGRVLIHLAGENRKSRHACGSAGCAGCSGCGGR